MKKCFTLLLVLLLCALAPGESVTAGAFPAGCGLTATDAAIAERSLAMPIPLESTVREKYTAIVRRLIEKNQRITTMESCTGGLLASLLTDTEGASAIFQGSFVTYSNAAKVAAGVPAEIIDTYGVYSQQTADAMASACRAAFEADFGVGITGSFGNVDPANADSVPGEVYFSIEHANGTARVHCAVPPQPSRLDYKLYMANLVADQLLALIR